MTWHVDWRYAILDQLPNEVDRWIRFIIGEGRNFESGFCIYPLCEFGIIGRLFN